ncbi:MAG TPA: zf-HC2 domain-containing protein [Bryobacteraceae bacterium]|nr:zf-HC2 domain-containing protein [Bryobacteraceae bacterium]
MGCWLNKSVAEELVVAYAARTLNADEEADFERHLENCDGCRELAAQQRAVWSVLEEWRPLPVSPDFDRKLAQRIAYTKPNGWWQNLFRTWGWRPLIPLAAACTGLAFAFLLKNDDGAGAPAPANQPGVRIEQQVEHALDDMDMLKQIGVDAAGAKPRSSQKI